MSHLLSEVLAQADNGSPAVVALSAESVTIFLFAGRFIEQRQNWLDRAYDPLDEVTDEDWDVIERLVGNAYTELMTPVLVCGTISLWLTDTPPDRWLILNGDEISRTDYSELFALWGTTFGAGDGSTTFLLPDMRSLHPKGAGAVIDLGEVTGASVVHLTTAQLPSHDHGINDPGHVHRERVGNGASAYILATGGGSNPTVGSGLTTNTAVMNTVSATTGITTQPTGSGDAVDTSQPSIGVHYIVYAGQS